MPVSSQSRQSGVPGLSTAAGGHSPNLIFEYELSRVIQQYVSRSKRHS